MAPAPLLMRRVTELSIIWLAASPAPLTTKPSGTASNSSAFHNRADLRRTNAPFARPLAKSRQGDSIQATKSRTHQV
jgi:hypothetical protein